MKRDSNTDPLNDKALKALRPRQKPYKVSDGQGLFVIVRPDGAKWWRFRYRYGGRAKELSLGVYPSVTLKRARQKRNAARDQLELSIDPSAERRSAKLAQANTFETIARQWLAIQEEKLAPSTHEKSTWMLETFVFPHLGRWPVTDIEPPDVLKALRRIEARGRHETAHRTRQRMSQVFRFAVASGLATRDPAGDLKGALAPIQRSNFAALTNPAEVGALLRAIDGYQGQPAVAAALRLAPLVFVRPGELRAARWSEIDLEAAEWRIPAERTKLRREHLVPLADQAVAILEDLGSHTRAGELVFPSLRSRGKPLSENTLNAALRSLGYDGSTHVAHGFRTTASTLLHETGWDSQLIELQLAHADRNTIRAIYNRSERLAERRKMMQAWAEYLDSLKAGAAVRAIRSRA